MPDWILTIMEFLRRLFPSPQQAPVAPQPVPVPIPEPMPIPDPAPVLAPPVADIDTLLPWSSPANNKHNIRVLCDLSGLTLYQKNVITACLQVESGWQNYRSGTNIPMTHKNLSAAGALLSTDWGIVQCNDYYHIGKGKDYPSVDYVLANPRIMVQWMIDLSKKGKLSLWSSYSSGAYLRFMP